MVRVHVVRARGRACCQMVSEVLLVSVRVVRARARARARARVVRVVRAGARACCQMGLALPLPLTIWQLALALPLTCCQMGLSDLTFDT